MNSVWKENINLKQFPKLNGAHKTDILIIGGGMAGILCALLLQNSGVDYMLVEGGRIAGGTTGNTTAKITVQHGLIYSRIAKEYGLEKAQMYYDIQRHALEKLCEISRNIDCSFEEKSHYVYSLHHRSKLEEEQRVLEKIHAHAVFCERTELPLKTCGAIQFPQQAQFHPLRFISAICRDLNIFENTFIRELNGTTAVFDRGTIQAQKIIVATHFPFLNRHGSYFLKLYQHRSYVIALAHAQELNGMYLDEAKDGLSFRNYDGMLLLGGGAHRTGKKGGNWEVLRQAAQTFYPDAQEKFFWAAQDCMSLDALPLIGPYSKNTKDLYVAAGFNKWGMTSSMVAAMILRDLVLEKQNDYEALFSPSRSILKPQLMINIMETAANFLSFSTKRCPHLGCALKWNPVEHSWDCPCHGSRFDSNGTVLENPAMKKLD